MTTAAERYPLNKVPADASDAEHLKNTRVTMWWRVAIVLAIIVAIAAALVINFGWMVMWITAAILFIAGMAFLIGFGSMHNMTKEETAACENGELPGHDIFDPEDVRLTAGHSYVFDCAPSDLYPYLAQMNLIKAGFYSFDFLERAFSFHIVNDYTIRPEWQSVKVGDWMYYHQNGAGTGVFAVKENEYICTYSDTRYKPTQPLALAWRPKWIKDFAWSWNFIIQPLDGGERCKLISSAQTWWPEDTSKLTIARFMVQWGLPSNFMINGMAPCMGRLAEADAKARRAGKPRPGYNYTK